MAFIRFVFAVLLNVIFISATGTLDLDLVTEVADEDQVCTTKLSYCSLNLADTTTMTVSVTRPTQGPKGDKGERGLKGDIGLTGIKGEQGIPGDIGTSGYDGLPGRKGAMGLPGINGEKGEPGMPGLPSPPGIPGLMGTKGEPGEKGSKGDLGYTGLRGTTGSQGYPGRDAAKGEPGKPGLPGPRGPPGMPGKMGSCPCANPEEDSPNIDSASDPKPPIGSLSNPANVVCKNEEITIVPGEFIYLSPGKIKVKCDIRDGLLYTCIPSKTNTGKLEEKAITYASENVPFWLSSKGLSLKELYNVTHDQIMWIQEKSTSAFQRIRYHCENSMPYNPKDAEHSMLMLTWNDMLFGPTKSETTPFVYTVPTVTDGCLYSKDSFSSSIVEIRSYSAQRLPVVDFLIRDSEDEAKTVFVEHLELCFH